MKHEVADALILCRDCADLFRTGYELKSIGKPATDKDKVKCGYCKRTVDASLAKTYKVMAKGKETSGNG